MTASPSRTYTNDILGNRTWRNQSTSTNGVKYEWDVLNRATKIVNVSSGGGYAYRADGMRISKQEGYSLTWGGSSYSVNNPGGSAAFCRYFYDGQMPVEDDSTVSGTTTYTKYGMGCRGIDYIAKTSGGNTTVGFPIYDGHGNMIATIGRNGNSYTVGDQREYDVWGQIRAQGSLDAYGGPVMRYCANLGHKSDDESGLIYMRARYCEPWTGRFVSEDPDRHGSNWTVYANNDPVNKIDVNGKVVWWLAAFLAGFISCLAYSLTTQIYEHGLGGISVADLARDAFIGGLTGLALAVGGTAMLASGGAMAEIGQGLLAISSATSARGLAGMAGYAAGGAGGAVINIIMRNLQISILINWALSDPIDDPCSQGGY